jgi:hypothetical protein
MRPTFNALYDALTPAFLELRALDRPVHPRPPARG